MTYKHVMAELKKLGKPSTVKTYERHGAGDNVFGVSYADFYKLQKKIKVDHELARKLWDSGNTDARTLATMIADPQECCARLLDGWLKGTSYRLLVDAVAGVTARSPVAEKQMEKWMKSKKEDPRQAGYSVLAGRLCRDLPVSDASCKGYLKTIEKEIHGSPNWARYSMNNALIAIGIYKPSLTKAAIAAAKRIGKVEVDHGDTSCKTPDAVPYIQKALKRKKKK